MSQPGDAPRQARVCSMPEGALDHHPTLSMLQCYHYTTGVCLLRIGCFFGNTSLVHSTPAFLPLQIRAVEFLPVYANAICPPRHDRGLLTHCGVPKNAPCSMTVGALRELHFRLCFIRLRPEDRLRYKLSDGRCAEAHERTHNVGADARSS